MDEDMQREIGIVLSLKHPNIIHVFEVLRSSRKLYIFMEFASGGTARGFLDKTTEVKLKSSSLPEDSSGGIPERIAKLVIFKDIAIAMKFVHSQQIVHRDCESHQIIYIIDNPKTNI